MIKNKSILLLLICLPTIFLLGEKSSNDIQKDIDKRNTQLNNLKNEIENVEIQIQKKIDEEKNNQDIINQINNKINLTEKLITTLNEEEIYLSKLIFKTETRISQKEKELKNLQDQLKNRVRYLYKNGRENTISKLIDLNNINKSLFRIKYLKILNEHENIIKERINTSIDNLKKEQEKLNEEKERKKFLLTEKNKKFNNLENDKKLKKEFLNKIKTQKKSLLISLESKKNILKEIEQIINDLFKDKKEIKKREEELAKIRSRLNKSTIGNFAKMKGKLPWPAEGNIINKFGLQKNSVLNTVYENIGIDIKTETNASVYSVLDGFISKISYVDKNYGNIIIVDHGGGYYTVYSNIDNIQVNEKDYVKALERIAKVTENESNEHILHFEVWGNQENLNPEVWLNKK